MVTAVQPQTEQLPAANIRTAENAFPEEEFCSIQNIPVFAEHETTAKDGRKLRFTRHELEAVCDRCNRRIEQTGDFAAVVFGHTPSPDDPNGKMPDLAGFAGPFRIGSLGQPGGRQRYAILADMHFFKDEMARVKKHPRRSPEVWLEENYAEMFLDPIALLGSEAPRLDMGLLYSASRQGRTVEKYTAVAPAAGSVFIPTDRYQATPTSDHQNQPGGNAMLAPDDIRQIVDAIEQLEWVQGVKQLLQGQAGPNTSVPGAPEMPVGGAEVPPMGAPPAPPVPGAPMDAMPPAPPAPMDMPPAPMDAPPAPMDAPPAAPEAPPDAPPDAGPPAVPPEEEDPEKMSAQNYEANSTGEYQTADQRTDMGGTQIDHDLGSQKKNYAALDEMEDDEFEQYAARRKRRKRGAQKRNYEAGSADSESSEKPSEGDVEPEDPGPKGTGSASDTDESTGEYQTASPPEKFAMGETGRQVHQLRQDVTSLKGQLEHERGARVDAERYSALSERRQLYAFDLDAEVERCRYSKMSAEQFAGHVTGIETNYRQLPVGFGLPNSTSQSDTSFAATNPKQINGQGPAKVKYSKELSDKAMRICETRQMAGEETDYEEVLTSLHRGDISE